MLKLIDIDYIDQSIKIDTHNWSRFNFIDHIDFEDIMHLVLLIYKTVLEVLKTLKHYETSSLLQPLGVYSFFLYITCQNL